MKNDIAIVGMACRYPDASSPTELWENVLAGRRAFRRIPPQRLRVEDYFSADRSAPDCIYIKEGCFIEGYDFDRLKYRVVGSAYRSTDLAHWLALDIAAQALTDAGFDEGKGLPREATGVFLGNTLTGEFSRANTLRMRWPYVRRVVEATLAERGETPETRSAFIDQLERLYKAPFPAATEETLAGGLSNTIAGRICNQFDLQGGGYTVDGACASSLLAVANACSALAAGDLDVGIAGGVDLSIDPFELVGFARAGALTADQMRVYDERSSGFLPGEGCGFVVLMRLDDALRRGCRAYAVIKGWGISSDGSGGITRPEVEGQLLALRRAYRRAGFGIDSVGYFEGHGTGTSVGDATELKALSLARDRSLTNGAKATVGSIKANIGHTKAAAGVAGLIKATMALHSQTLPPTTGCRDPHELIQAPDATLTTRKQAELWPADLPLRAGVSAMGFGGINAHLALEGSTSERRAHLSAKEQELIETAQDCELFLFNAESRKGLIAQVEKVLGFAAQLSLSEVADLAVYVQKQSVGVSPLRAAFVAASPVELASRLEILRSWLLAGVEDRVDAEKGLFLGTGREAKIGFLFSGQGAPVYLDGGIFARRFQAVRELYDETHLPQNGDRIATIVMQPAVVTASLAGLRLLKRLGIEAQLAVGQSLGEITALHWAGAMSEDALLRIVSVRARAMMNCNGTPGSMASVRAGSRQVQALLNGGGIVIAGINSPEQTIISGPATEVAGAVARLRTQGYASVQLPVSHAFHSPLVTKAASALDDYLSQETFRLLERPLISTVTGQLLKTDEDLQALLSRQIVAPVKFQEAVTTAASLTNLFIEVGSGQVLTGLVRDFLDTPAVAIDAGGESLSGLLKAVGAAFALGAEINFGELYAQRRTRPFDLEWHPKFFGNPCELAPLGSDLRGPTAFSDRPERAGLDESADQETVNLTADHQAADAIATSAREVVRRLLAQRTELPETSLKDSDRLLADLHLNSIAVSQIVVEAARRLNLAPPAMPTDFSKVTVAEMAGALEEMLRNGGTSIKKPGSPAGVDSWVRCFRLGLVEAPLVGRNLLSGASDWEIVAVGDPPLKDQLLEAFKECAGSGVVIVMPPDPHPSGDRLLLEAARRVLSDPEKSHFVLVQDANQGAALARTLHMEDERITTCVIHIPSQHPRAVDWVVAEVKAAIGYTEAHYDEDGTRRLPMLRFLADHDTADESLLGPADVLLVTGGGKGIAFECALFLARQTHCKLALVGRSLPERDEELAANLERMAESSVQFRYYAADVENEKVIRDTLAQAGRECGPVTAVLYGAGTNVPKALQSLDERDVAATLAPKVDGARHLLAALDPDRLRLLVTFGSLIARTGMKGEGHYALANERLRELTEQWQAGHPDCKCLAVEWSVWSGVGMGERLGRIDALLEQGITPIPVDRGIRMLEQLINDQTAPTAAMIAGRFGKCPTLKMEAGEWPMARFIEEVVIDYPGIELIVEATLSPQTDPYLADHRFEGEMLFPAVLGLEAISQVAGALTGVTGTTVPPRFEQVKFNRAIVVPADGTRRIRIAALVHKPGLVEVVIRSEETDFQFDHFGALCRFCADPIVDEERDAIGSVEDIPVIELEPKRELYGDLLFHGGRFRRLQAYRRMTSTECLAEIAPGEPVTWFGSYLPQALTLGDAARRDAIIHAVQVCVPDVTLLPISVDRLTIGDPHAGESCIVRAQERTRDGEEFIYDVEARTLEGSLLERWEGLRLRAVGRSGARAAWTEPLLGPYLERRVRDLTGHPAVNVVIERCVDECSSRGDRAMRRLVGRGAKILRTSDGKPEVMAGVSVSASHSGELTLAVAGEGPLSCDLERVISRPSTTWQDLLGADGFRLAHLITRSAAESLDRAATRVWGAIECLKKAGAGMDAPLVLASHGSDGWVFLSSGRLGIASCAATGKQSGVELVMTILTDKAGDRNDAG